MPAVLASNKKSPHSAVKNKENVDCKVIVNKEFVPQGHTIN